MRCQSSIRTHSFFEEVEDDVIHPSLSSVEDQGRVHLTRCLEVSRMIRYISSRKKIEAEYLLCVCVLQSFINSKKLMSYDRINWMLNSPLENMDNDKLKKLKKIHNNLFEEFPQFFKINSVKFEYSINFVIDYLGCPIWFKYHVLKLAKIIFSSKKLKCEKPSVKSLRTNVLKKGFLKKKMKFKGSTKDKKILLFKLCFNEGMFFQLKKISFEGLCEALFIEQKNCDY